MVDLRKRDEIRRKLRRVSVGVAGLGGLGSNAAVSLARAGVGRLVLVDFDKVEESNLDRQYYFRHQIGWFKVDALTENIRNINPTVEVDEFNMKLKKGSMEKPFKDVDVVIEALDDAETKAAFIDEMLSKLPGKPLVAASGVAGYGNSERIKTLRYGNLFLCYDEYAPSSEESVLLAPRVALMANWEANLVLEIVLGGEKYDRGEWKKS